MTYTQQAYAKLNLTLDILGKRSDGYHEMNMVMQSIDLSDTVSVSEAPSDGVRRMGISALAQCKPRTVACLVILVKQSACLPPKILLLFLFQLLQKIDEAIDLVFVFTVKIMLTGLTVFDARHTLSCHIIAVAAVV